MPPSPPDAPDSPLERFKALVLRELHAEDVRLVDVRASREAPPNVLATLLPDGRQLRVTFETAPEDREALERRLEILVRTFAQALEQQHPRDARVSRAPTHSLQEELRALAARAQAVNAVVIDAHSPVIWGTARGPAPGLETPDPEEEMERLSISRSDLLKSVEEATRQAADEDAASPKFPQDVQSDDATHPASMAAPKSQTEDITERVLRDVRELPSLRSLRKGRNLHHAVAGEEYGYLVQSFAGIYILTLIFDRAFDELRAERAALDALPRIERLVLALPPLDPRPRPMANVVRLRRARRR